MSSARLFIGRETQMQWMMNAVEEETPRHVSLYGMPHVGKSFFMGKWTACLRENQYRTPSGKKVFIFSKTLSYDYPYLLYSILRSIKSRLEELYKELEELYKELEEHNKELEKRYKGLEEYYTGLEELTADAELFDKIEALRASGTDYEMLGELVRLCVKKMTDNGYRFVMVLDEFEMIGNSRPDHPGGKRWSEEEYFHFCRMLLDKTLDLFCVTVSRPSIQYVLSGYERKLSPFRPFLLKEFDDDEMQEYMAYLAEIVGSSKTNDKNYVQELLYFCGRNPYLLVKASLLLRKKPELSPSELFEKGKDLFEPHYRGVFTFLSKEEVNKAGKSLAHIVKSYFGVSRDYKDIIDNYINLGYIELHDKDSRFTHPDEYDYPEQDEDNTSRKYVTVCVAFVHYLYSHKLKYVQDVRDLVTAVVYTLRDITMKELKRIYGDNWNVELVKRYISRAKWDDPFDESHIAFDKFLVFNSYTNRWVTKTYDELRDGSRRKREIQNFLRTGEMIPICVTSLNFVGKEIKDYGIEDDGVVNGNREVVMPALDPINIRENGNIIAKYAGRVLANGDALFSQYFDVNDADTMQRELEALQECLKTVHEARNKMGHFHRHGYSENEIQKWREACIEVLSIIYGGAGGHTGD